MKQPYPYGYVSLNDTSGSIHGFRHFESDIPVYSKKQVEEFLEEICSAMMVIYDSENVRYSKIRAMINEFKQF